jgi:hypothetical protein
MDYNFPLFMGLAIQMYESTLVSDNSPYDQYREGNTSALTAQQQRGLELFLKPTNQGGAGCIFCHSGPEFTSASVANVKASGRIASFGNFRFDTGLFNIGVRPSQEDLEVSKVPLAALFKLSRESSIKSTQLAATEAEALAKHSLLLCRTGISIENSVPSPGVDSHCRIPLCFSTTI